MFRHTKGFSSFSVDNLEAAREFYDRILGLEVHSEDGFLRVQLAGGHAIMIYPKPANHLPATYTVLNFEVKDVEATVEELGRRGVTFEIYDLPDIKTDARGITMQEPKMAWFQDPAGNLVSVMEELDTESLHAE